MSYILKSIATRSFWRYALFSSAAVAKLLATIGSLFLFMEMMDFFSIYTKDNYSKYAFAPILVVSLIYVVFSRRPVTSVTHKAPRKDYCVEVKIGDIFAESGDVVISSNTTFDTDVAGGLISQESLQGQLTSRVFGGSTVEIDRQIELALAGISYAERANALGNSREYPIGTVAKVITPGKAYYFVAMARLNEQGNAVSSVRSIEDALRELWDFVASNGELRTLVVPLMGTGRGRIELPRKKVIERIAQSFADASRERVFTNKLVIIVHPKDAEAFSLNLFEVRDYLTHSLHF